MNHVAPRDYLLEKAKLHHLIYLCWSQISFNLDFIPLSFIRAHISSVWEGSFLVDSRYTMTAQVALGKKKNNVVVVGVKESVRHMNSAIYVLFRNHALNPPNSGGLFTGFG